MCIYPETGGHNAQDLSTADGQSDFLTGEVIAIWETGLCHLVQEIAEGNGAALSLLYEQCLPQITRYLHASFNSTLDDGEIDAVIVQTMDRVWRKGGTFNETTDQKARSWITEIAKNLALDLIRTKQRAKEIEVEIDDERFLGSHFENPAHNSNVDLHFFYERLTVQERKVAEFLAAGYKDVEIATEMGICKPRVNQIKKQLAKKAVRFFDLSRETQA